MDEMPEVDTRNKLRMANSVWHQPSLAPHKEFADVAINSLKSEFYTLGKDDAGNQNSVNAWCKEKPAAISSMARMWRGMTWW